MLPMAVNAQDEQFSGHKGIDLNVEAGPDFSLQSGGPTTFSAKLEVGKKFNKNFYFGVGGGVSTGGGATSFPILGVFRTYFPMESTKVIPTVAVKGGYALADEGNAIVSLSPGVIIPISPSVDFLPGLEYTAGFVKGGTSHSLGVHVGVGIHRSASGKKKPWKPTRENGLQYAIDLVTRTPWNIEDGNGIVNLNLLAMYKMDNNISFGVGLGYGDGSHPYSDEGTYSDETSIDTDFYTFFVRGKYRLHEGTVSPFASVDLGTRFLSDIGDEKQKSMTYFITPAVGLSFKVAGNSYLDVRAGYELATAPVKTDDRYGNKAAGLTIGLTFTHTMKFFSGDNKLF